MAEWNVWLPFFQHEIKWNVWLPLKYMRKCITNLIMWQKNYRNITNLICDKKIHYQNITNLICDQKILYQNTHTCPWNVNLIRMHLSGLQNNIKFWYKLKEQAISQTPFCSMGKEMKNYNWGFLKMPLWFYSECRKENLQCMCGTWTDCLN